MPPPTFYVETSVWGCLAPRQPADRKRVVKRLFRLLNGVRGICVVSDGVVAEIELAPVPVVKAILRQLAAVRPVVHPITEEAEALARAYIENRVLPERREADALHVAVATCLGADYLVSWNHRHMTRPLIRLQYEAVNRLKGYWQTPMLCNPVEACDELRGG